MNKKIEISGIGEVNFVKSKRAKRLRISINPFNGVRVSLPYFMSYKSALRFVMEKKQWIIDNSNSMSQKLEGLTLFDESTTFKTNLHEVVIQKKSTILVPKAKMSSEKLILEFPSEINLNKTENQEFIRKAIEESWRKEAKLVLPKRTEELAQKFGFTYGKVSVRNTKSRWGSCSFHNNISLSLHLMRLPEKLRDYVILHELTHTREKNHQAPFWNLLDTVTDGKAKLLDKELKQFSTRIY